MTYYKKVLLPENNKILNERRDLLFNEVLDIVYPGILMQIKEQENVRKIRDAVYESFDVIGENVDEMVEQAYEEGQGRAEEEDD